MTDKIFWLLTAAVNPPVIGPVNVDYFLKGLNTPLWHWLFRLSFGLGLAVALGVYFYYRANDRDQR